MYMYMYIYIYTCIHVICHTYAYFFMVCSCVGCGGAPPYVGSYALVCLVLQGLDGAWPLHHSAFFCAEGGGVASFWLGLRGPELQRPEAPALVASALRPVSAFPK